MREAVLEKFAALRRRYLWVRGIDLFLEIAFVMTLTAGAMLLFDRLLFEMGWAAPHLSQPPFVIAILGGALVMSGLLAAGILIARPASPASLAWQADRVMGTEERFLSALEIAAAGGSGGLAGLVLQDAARLPVDPKRVLPRSPIGYRWAILLTFVTGGMLLAYPPQVWPAPHAAFRAIPSRGAAPLDVRFEDLSQGAIGSWTWDFGDGVQESGETATHRYEKPGRYTAVLTLEGPGGRSVRELSIEVLPPGHAVADFEVLPAKGRAPLSVSFRNMSQNGLRFRWEFGDGATSNERDPRHVYVRPGDYTVTLRAENDLGHDVVSRPRAVRVVGEDAPLADFRAHPREGPAPLTVQFEDLSTGRVTDWEWDNGDMYAGRERHSGARDIVHTYSFPGTYTVTLKVKGPTGEDVEEKVAYIKVQSEGSGQGGGGAAGGNAGGGAGPKGSQGAGGQKGALYGDKSNERDLELDPSIVKADDKGGSKVEKSKKVFTKGAGDAGDQTYESVYPDYLHAAEETMNRDRIPPQVRDYVKRYFESIQPK